MRGSNSSTANSSRFFRRESYISLRYRWRRKPCDPCSFGGHHVRVQAPLALHDDSKPEPDIAVVSGSFRDYRNAHPRTAVLVVEISDATLAFDREDKAQVYAQADIPEYWIVNLIERRLETFRDPGGSGYRTHLVVPEDDALSPLAAPEARVEVSSLLP